MSTENKRDTNPGKPTLNFVPAKDLDAAKTASRRNAGLAVAATGVAVLATVVALKNSQDQKKSQFISTESPNKTLAVPGPTADSVVQVTLTAAANSLNQSENQNKTLVAQVSTKDAQATANAGQKKQEQVQAPTQTPTPTRTEMPSLGLPVVPQELNANNFRENVQTESEVWQKILNSLIQDYAKKDSLKGTNSMLTTLTNMPAINPAGKFNLLKDFDKDPEKEPGLGHNDKDISNYKNIYTLDDATNLLSLARDNEVGLKTAGFYGNTNDRDMISYYGAALMVALKHPTEFQATTIADLKAGKYPPAFEPEIAQTQNEIFKRIQRQFLPVSEEEKGRRTNKTDGTSLIPEKFWKSDQYITCPVYMQNAKSRELQLQGIRQVIYTDAGKMTFTTADSGQAGSLMAFSFDPDTQTWGVRSEGNRYYPTNKYDIKIVYSTNANGEQEIVCGIVTPKPTGQESAKGGSQPGQPNNEKTPTSQIPTVTPARTQPVQPTRTPGGSGATPSINTPVNTPAPVVTSVPQNTVPPVLPTSVVG